MNRRLVGLIVVQAGDAVFNVVADDWVRDDLQRLGFPLQYRRVFPVIKTASAIGLLAGLRWPVLGRRVAGLLVVYFLLALGFHARARDALARYAPAMGMLVWSAAAYRDFDATYIGVK